MYQNKKINLLSPAMIAVYIIVGVLLIVYFGFTIFFNWHYLPNTTIGSVECGFKTLSYVEEANAKLAEDYTLTVIDRKENSFSITGKDISYSYVNKGEEAAVLKKQNPFTWPAALFISTDYQLDISVEYMKESLSTIISEWEIYDENYMISPENAYIDLGEDGYSIVSEVLGCIPIAQQIESEILAGLDTESTSITLSDACYVKPDYTSDSKEIKNAASQLDSYLNAVITYEIKGYNEELGKDDIVKLISIDENFVVSINEKEITKFVQSLASKYNTYGDKREFKTTQGDVLLIGGGDYGWVISKSKEAAQILEDLEGGEPVTREPIYEQTALYSGPNDIGNTYIEVDYTSQHLWYYKDGEMLLESDFVSGNMRNGNGSPDGIYKIVYKDKDAVLKGEDYTSPVDYFMPFAYNVGFHDASWRSEFGGEIYKTSGSHGCINLPADFAQTLFENVETGTPVVAYYREAVELKSENAKISNAFSYVSSD